MFCELIILTSIIYLYDYDDIDIFLFDRRKIMVVLTMAIILLPMTTILFYSIILSSTDMGLYHHLGFHYMILHVHERFVFIKLTYHII